MNIPIVFVFWLNFIRTFSVAKIQLIIENQKKIGEKCKMKYKKVGRNV